jgi:hypothetical protein
MHAQKNTLTCTPVGRPGRCSTQYSIYSSEDTCTCLCAHTHTHAQHSKKKKSVQSPAIKFSKQVRGQCQISNSFWMEAIVAVRRVIQDACSHIHTYTHAHIHMQARKRRHCCRQARDPRHKIRESGALHNAIPSAPKCGQIAQFFLHK